ncbi:MAG: DUF6150 family protein [Prevotellaceae bacterium]|jgi:hypothetical protein|nr:DUF6150 family protein [Prevotellaceae bacterium]
MKTFLLILFLFCAVNFTIGNEQNQSATIENCEYKGKRLSGKVFVSESKYDNIDFIVFVDNERPDFRVTKVPLFSSFECGQWHFTDMKGNADLVIFITDNRYEADFVIEIKNY